MTTLTPDRQAWIVRRLEKMKFEERFPGFWERRLGGQHKYAVSVTLQDEDGNWVAPKYAVTLPHKCDAWTITQTDSANARQDLMAFVKEGQSAATLLNLVIFDLEEADSVHGS